MEMVASLAATAALAIAVPAFAQTTTMPKNSATKMSQAECKAAWTKLDASKGGRVANPGSGRRDRLQGRGRKQRRQAHPGRIHGGLRKGLVTAYAATGSGGRGMTGSEPTSPKK